MRDQDFLDVGASRTSVNQYSFGSNMQEENESLLAKLVTGFAAVVIVFSIYVMTPYIIGFFSEQNIQIETEVVVVPEDEKSTNYVDAYIWTAKLKLEELQLNHRLQLSLYEQSAIQINGNISAKEMPNWERFLEWYGGREGFPKLFHDVSATAISGNIPELKSVWFGSSPKVYFLDGQVGKLGATLKDGWKIISIEAWAVFVERDGITITLSY